MGRNAEIPFKSVLAHLNFYANKYGANVKVLVGIAFQESGFKNFGVHRDGTGHGLIGLDDGGLMPAFEKFAGQRFGRGATARTIPPAKQFEFLAKTIAALRAKHGDSFAAAREWHRGAGNMNDARGLEYEQLIRGHIARLFPA
jgi:hypothetical protein